MRGERLSRVCADQSCAKPRVRVDLKRDAADTAEYVGYRMKRVGAEQEPFSSGALSLIHEASRGPLRDADRIATDSLKLACKKRVRIVDRDVVSRAQQAEFDDDN